MNVLMTFIVFLVLIFLGLPIVHSMLVSSLFYVAFLSGGGLTFFVVPQRLIYGMDSFALMAVPFFILAAEIMNEGGITKKLFSFARALVGHIPGGLGHVNVLASILMAGMSGSAVADASGLGKIEIEAMNEVGFDPEFSAAVTAASSTIGPIIPPSIPLIVYAVAASISSGRILIAGLLPGVLMGLGLMVIVYIVAKKRNYPRDAKTTLKEKWHALCEAFFPMMMPVILIWGFMGGIFTPTEAAVIAILYAVILLVVYDLIDRCKGRPFLGFKKMMKHLFKACINAGNTASCVLAVIGAAAVMGSIVLREQVPQALCSFIASSGLQTWVVLLILNVLFLFLGCFMEANALILMCCPILVPLLMQLGVSPVQFGVVMVVNLMIGMITPPFGVSMYITCDIAHINMKQFTKAAWPMIAVLILVLMLITYIEPLTLWLPTLFMG